MNINIYIVQFKKSKTVDPAPQIYKISNNPGYAATLPKIEFGRDIKLGFCRVNLDGDWLNNQAVSLSRC
jgi:hypothetical protein